MSVKIIVDSTVDMAEAVRSRVSAVVPLSVRFGEEEYKDGETITPQKFYEMLAKSEQLPTTSQITPSEFGDVFQKLVEEGHEVVAITLILQMRKLRHRKLK